MGEELYEMKHAGKLKILVLMADPQTRGQIRELMHKTVQDSIVLTLAKDLTYHPANEIAELLGRST